MIVGTMRWGKWFAEHSVDTVSKMLQFCYDNELYRLDMADIYGGYTTEKLVGDALVKSGLSREKFQLITKCGIQYPTEDNTITTQHYNTTPQHILQSVENSLNHLQTDYLDVLLIHRPDYVMDYQSIAETFQKLQQSGKVKEFGVSNFTVSQFHYLNAFFPLVCNQIEFSPTHFNPLFDDTLADALVKNYEIMAWSPMGSIFSESQHESALQPFAEKYQCSLASLALAWIVYHPAKIVPVVGTSSIEHLKDMIPYTSIQLEKEDWYAMLELIRGKKVE